MNLPFLRRVARRLFAGPPVAAGPLPPADPALSPDPAAVALAGTAMLLAGRGTLRATLPPPPAGMALLAVAVEAGVTGAGARLTLSGAGGTAHDALDLAPRAAPWRVCLFAPSAAGATLALEAGARPTRLHLAAVTTYALPEAALAPARLVPARPLAAEPDWSRAYGHPPPEDGPARLRERAFARLAAPALVTLLDGLALWLEPGDELSRAVMLSGTYEPDTLLAVAALLPPGGTFVDIGAHCGLIAAFAARRAGRVLAFEPSPREFVRLATNLAANSFTNATAQRAAVAQAAGTVQLRLAEPGHAGHNTIGSRFAYDGVATAAIETVPAITLDDALAGLDRCDLIKMDIEGAELRALHGGETALARLRPALILEVFDRALAGCNDTEAALFAWLAAHGYAAHALDPATGRFDTPAAPAPGVSRNVVALPK